MIKINLTPPHLSDRQIQRFWGFVDKSSGYGPEGTCWQWIGAMNLWGYGRFTTSDKPRTFTASRLGFFLAYDEWPPTPVLHHCDNPACVNGDHLFTGTQQDNLDDAKSKDRVPTGDRHWARTQPHRVPKGSRRSQVKLNEDAVIVIRKRVANGSTQTAIATEYGVSQSLISLIVNRKNWTHI